MTFLVDANVLSEATRLEPNPGTGAISNPRESRSSIRLVESGRGLRVARFASPPRWAGLPC
jgi:hypothetical protein